jgi:hypothetical protein
MLIAELMSEINTREDNIDDEFLHKKEKEEEEEELHEQL